MAHFGKNRALRSDSTLCGKRPPVRTPATNRAEIDLPARIEDAAGRKSAKVDACAAEAASSVCAKFLRRNKQALLSGGGSGDGQAA